MLCPICRNHESLVHPQYGALPCKHCTARRSTLKSPDKQVEFTSKSIKHQRKEYAKSIIQPYRDGEVSKEYLDAYGKKNIRATEKQIKQSRNVWGDITKGTDVKKSK